MAHDWAKIYDDCFTVIEQNPINTIEDLICFLPCSRSSFYEYFPATSDKLEAIKRSIEKRKIDRKSHLRNRWEKSDNPTLMIAAYKLMANEDELGRLSVQINKNVNAENTGINWSETKTYDSNEKAD